MEKEQYIRAELQVTEFETEDVITSSGDIVLDEDDLELLP